MWKSIWTISTVAYSHIVQAMPTLHLVSSRCSIQATGYNASSSLANYCEVCRELPPDVKQQQESRNRAGDYKQQLFVAMIDQDKPVATSCGLCKEPLHAHKVAGPEPLDGVFVSYCCHLFHTPCALSCLNRTCPACQQSFSYLPA